MKLSESEKLMDELVQQEWEQFTQVNNIGGRASCQDDFRTFSIMRKSQYQAWSEEAMASWLSDLREAAQAGRNLLAEKYAWMMRDTDLEGFVRLNDALPLLSGEKEALIEELTELEVKSRERFSVRYPALSERGRPLRRTDARPGEASVETYARGELTTYSQKTLELLREHYIRLMGMGSDPCEITMEYMVSQYGYASLEDAQREMGARCQ